MIPEDDPVYQKNTKEQYEALGRFIESFEAMVNEARQLSIELLSKDSRHERFIEIPFHHGVMTAKPIFEIMRALIIEAVTESIKRQEDEEKGITQKDPPPIVDKQGDPLVFDTKDRDIFLGVLKTIAEEYNALVNIRNNLLHATWFVGYVSSLDSTASEFYVRKFALGKEGMSSLKLPKNATQLIELRDRCETAREWLWWLQGCLIGGDLVKSTFINEGGEWKLVTYSGQKSTLPEKSVSPFP